MDDESLTLIEQEISVFVRRVTLTEKRFGNLERSAYILLRELYNHGPIGVKRLAEELHLDDSTVSRQASALVRSQWIEKIPNPDDGRAYFYQITASGIAEMKAYAQKRYHYLAHILKDWSEQERTHFGKLLQKYNAILEQMDY
ncbi:putative HTH-type transcriptional regulator YxaD [Lentibacillus kapialis]|uniref:HTH-type transcriptional regulator YxaD n=1 Tax=Lentibacillus kapialis TaxID=340214 RepID=A0A917PYD1_9BACI|nr:MarR family transcriptional regulator [Lentibacillus kapialis]GGJ99426.1 putative HTH-type transcriptional regulator YxaD [Lentibacillus kapialis]